MAHDKVWTTLFSLLCSHLPPGWTMWKDKVISTTDIPCLSQASKKPDGLLWHKEDKLIHVLEFKRTTDFFPDSFELGFLRKFIKYTPLVQALETANKDHTVRLFVFTLGDRGLLDEERWTANWAHLSLPPKGLAPFCVRAALLAQEVATDILATYKVAMQNLSSAPGPT